MCNILTCIYCIYCVTAHTDPCFRWSHCLLYNSHSGCEICFTFSMASATSFCLNCGCVYYSFSHGQLSLLRCGFQIVFLFRIVCELAVLKQRANILTLGKTCSGMHVTRVVINVSRVRPPYCKHLQTSAKTNRENYVDD